MLELEDSRTCFAYEEVNAQGERGRLCTCNKCLPTHYPTPPPPAIQNPEVLRAKCEYDVLYDRVAVLKVYSGLMW